MTFSHEGISPNAPEEYLSMTEAAKLIPGRPSVSTVHRWAGRGVDGVVLASIRAGGRRYTSMSAIDEFLSQLNTSEQQVLKADGC